MKKLLSAVFIFSFLIVGGIVEAQALPAVQLDVASNLNAVVTSTSTPITIGTSSPAVSVYQQALTQLGFYNGPISGTYDAATQESVKAFEAFQQVPSDGILGTATGLLIEKALNPNLPATEPVPQPAPEQPAGPSDIFAIKMIEDPAPSTALVGNTPAMNSSGLSIQNFSKALRFGLKSNPQVMALQKKLQSLELYGDSINGNFDSETKIAVMAFQINNKLQADGVVGPITWAALAKN